MPIVQVRKLATIDYNKHDILNAENLNAATE
jgi:hypothetical protein